MRLVALVLMAACGGAHSTGTAPPSGQALCVLTAADFQASGVDAGPVTANVSDGGRSAYCTYKPAQSSSQGGVELDVFYPADESTETTAAGEATQTLQPLALQGADHARWDPRAHSGGPEFASLIARRGRLVFVIGIPADPDAQARLTKLGELVLARIAP